MRDYQKDPPVAGHWKPEVIRICVVTSMAGIGVNIEVLLIFVIAFLCVDCEMYRSVRAVVSGPNACIDQNFLCVIWYCIRYFVREGSRDSSGSEVRIS